MRTLVYEERQGFAVWAYWGVIVTTILAVVMLLAIAWRHSTATPAVLALFVVLLDVVVLNCLLLITRVYDDAVVVRLGAVFPVAWRRFPITQLELHGPITYAPLREAGGWGLRLGKFDGKFAIYWNARGDRGLRLQCGTRQYVIGSQEPQKLHEAIARAQKTALSVQRALGPSPH